MEEGVDDAVEDGCEFGCAFGRGHEGRVECGYEVFL